MMDFGARNGKEKKMGMARTCETCYWGSEHRGSVPCFSGGTVCIDGKDGEHRDWEPYTHGDAIRAMTDGELGEMIFKMAAVAKMWSFDQMDAWLESRVDEKRGFWG